MALPPRADDPLCGRLWAITNSAHRDLASVLAATLLTVVACTGQPAERPAAGPTRTPATSGAPLPTAQDGRTRTPLVVAVHPTRQGLALTGAQLAALRAGTVTDWAELGAPAGPLRTGSLDEVAADRDVLALVPATDVRPPIAVATVDGVHPLRDPAAYPATVPGPATPLVTTVTVTGDIMLARRVGDRLDQIGDQAAALRPMARRLAASDLTIGNLESTLSKAGAPRQGGDSFGARPQVRAGLRLAGFDVLSLANNHVGDYGPEALRQTLRRVEAGGFAGVGAGTDLAAAVRPVVVERNGLRFGIVAFDAIGETPAATATRAGALRVRMQPRTGPLNVSDLQRVTDVVRALRDEVDVVLVLPHWGTQYTTRTVRDQRVVARRLVRAGADLVVGGHPHWVQGVESLHGGLVVYSLGNFVFDMDSTRETQEGAVLELTYWGTELKAAELVPVVIGREFAPRVARGERAPAILDRIWSASGGPLRGSHAR
jgi:poly-gamma-glutamate capsule biosynthesis protein CapA/YwtB (metallophosphatase superfamily)